MKAQTTPIKAITPPTSRCKFFIFPLAVFIAGMILNVMPYFSWNFSTIPGGGDTLFNRYILEHGFQWLTGQQQSFWNAPFFYPAPLTVAYSDNHLGNLPFYALFRILGLDSDGALQGWISLQFMLNFGCCCWCLRRLGFGMIAASIGSYLYAFGMPVMAQIGHVQLLPRFMIPIAFCVAYEFWTRMPDTRRLTILALAVVWQFYSSIYLGTLLALMLAVMCIVIFCLKGRQIDLRKTIFGPRRDTLYRILIACLAITALAKLFLPYFEVWRLLNISQPLSIKLFLLPQLTSYLLPCADSWFWQWLYPLLSVQSYKNEHTLFAGAAALGATIAACWKLRDRQPSLIKICVLCWLTLLVFSLQIDGLSVYGFLRQFVPGLNSLRSMTRICLVMLFFQAVFAAWLIDMLAFRKQKALIAAFAGLLLLEGTIFHTGDKYDKIQIQARVDKLKIQVTALPPQSVFIYLPPPSANYQDVNIDAMLASQQCGGLTVNGYSGHNPPGWFPYGLCYEKFYNDMKSWVMVSGKLFYPDNPTLPWQIKLNIISSLTEPEKNVQMEVFPARLQEQ